MSIFGFIHKLKRKKEMSSKYNEILNEILSLDGALAAAMVDSHSGMMLASVGGGLDLEIAAAGNTEVVRAKLKTMQMLGLNDEIEDILITLKNQYHIICPIKGMAGVFIYVVLDHSKANLALARRLIHMVETKIS